MKTVSIRSNFKLEQHQHRLHFDGKLPLVIIYVRVRGRDNAQSGLFAQMSAIFAMLARKLGRYGYDAIWIIEKASGLPGGDTPSAPGAYSEGLALAADLVRNGYGQYLAVHRLDRITRKATTFLGLVDGVLKPSGAGLLVSSDSEEGPWPLSSTTERIAHFVWCSARRRHSDE